jgi:hypothetical protein
VVNKDGLVSADLTSNEGRAMRHAELLNTIATESMPNRNFMVFP